MKKTEKYAKFLKNWLHKRNIFLVFLLSDFYKLGLVLFVRDSSIYGVNLKTKLKRKLRFLWVPNGTHFDTVPKGLNPVPIFSKWDPPIEQTFLSRMTPWSWKSDKRNIKNMFLARRHFWPLWHPITPTSGGCGKVSISSKCSGQPILHKYQKILEIYFFRQPTLMIRKLLFYHFGLARVYDEYTLQIIN